MTLALVVAPASDEADEAELAAADLRDGLTLDDARAEHEARLQLAALGWRVTHPRSYAVGYTVTKTARWIVGTWQARVQRHHEICEEICATSREPGVVYRRLLWAARRIGRPRLRLLAGGAP